MIGAVATVGPQDRAAAIGAIGAVAIARPGARPFLVQAVPLAQSAEDLFQQACAALLIDNPDTRQGPQISLLRQIFGFTGAEANVAMALSSGQDVDEIARMRGVSLRNQIKIILAKTDTRRQAELVALLLRYAPIAR